MIKMKVLIFLVFNQYGLHCKLKLSFLQKILIYDDFIKNARHIRKVFFLYFKFLFLSYLVCVQSFKSTNDNSVSTKK